MTASCHQRDDYLDGCLGPQQAAAYETHLATCAACRRAVDVQTSIEDLLRAGDSQVDAAETVVAVRRRIRRGRLKRASLLAAAAALLLAPVAAVYLATANRGRPLPGPPRRVAEQVPRREVAGDVNVPAPAPVAWVRTSAAAIAVEQQSETPNVHIYQIFPAVNAPPQR